MKQDFPNADRISDEALCAMAATGDRQAEETLVMRYTRLVRICARPFFLAGGDSEDLIQEGMVGLLHAVREFDPAKEAGFHTFAGLCIRSRLRSAVRAAARGKHTPLNDSVPLETPSEDDSAQPFPYDPGNLCQEDPEAILIGRESLRERMSALKGRLSGLEAEILGLYLNGLSYFEIAVEVDRSPKSVDNAVQRIRRKLAQQLKLGDLSES